MNVESPAAPAAAADERVSRRSLKERRRTGSLSRRMIVIAAVWIAALLVIGGFALDRVLSRSIIAPKQHVLVLQVGRRVIVVGDSGTQMNPLCEITDEDEIASLMGQLKQDKADPVTRAFGSFFGKAEKEYDGEAADTQLRTSGSTDPAVDPELATTRAELSGLIEKVRSVSKQIGQSDA